MGGGFSFDRKVTAILTEFESINPMMMSKTGGDGDTSYFVEPPKMTLKQVGVEVSNTDAAVVALPRGGVLVNYSKGTVQFGIPPETIKDSLHWGLGVPTTFVILGEEMFDRQMGINIAEFEFPAYFNYFVFGKRVTLIVMGNVEQRVRAIYREALLGPEPGSFDPSLDFADHLPGGQLGSNNTRDTHWPDFVKEGLALDKQRLHITVDDLLCFETIDKPNVLVNNSGRHNQRNGGAKGLRRAESRQRNLSRINIQKNKIILDRETGTYIKWNEVHKKFIIREGKRTIAQIDHKFVKPRPRPERRVRYEPFEIPVFGVTMLGTSHGFDPNGNTTGFVVWVNRRGILVDPPPNSAQVLRDLSIPYRLIDGMILTHCHADHDAGAFQKILLDCSIKIYTTPTIMESFIRKYSAISNLSREMLRSLFIFEPVKIGKTKEIHGGQWNFFYSLHVIPTIGFEVKFLGEGIVYSGDTCTNNKLFDRMKREKLIGAGRYDDLKRLSPLNRMVNPQRLPDGTMTEKYHPYILHEAGVPPIHTPLDVLAKLPPVVRERLFVVHVDQKSLDAFKSNKKFKTIPQWSTLRIDVQESRLEEFYETHDRLSTITAILSSVPNFSKIKNVNHFEELYNIANRQHFPKGTIVARAGEEWKTSYVLRAGVLQESQGSTVGGKSFAATSSASNEEREEAKEDDTENNQEGGSSEGSANTTDRAKGPMRTTTKSKIQGLRGAKLKPMRFVVGDFLGEQALMAAPSGTGIPLKLNESPFQLTNPAVNSSTSGSTSSSEGEYSSGMIIEYDIIAATDVYVLSFDNKKLIKFFNSFEAGQMCLRNIRMVAKALSEPTWRTLRLNDCLERVMNVVQQQEFQKLLSMPKRFVQCESIVGRGETQKCLYLVEAGIANLYYKPSVEVTGPSKKTSLSYDVEADIENTDLGPGALIGSVEFLASGAPIDFSVTAKTECTVYEVDGPALLVFLDRYPGVKLQCLERRHL